MKQSIKSIKEVKNSQIMKITHKDHILYSMNNERNESSECKIKQCIIIEFVSTVPKARSQSAEINSTVHHHS